MYGNLGKNCLLPLPKLLPILPSYQCASAPFLDSEKGLSLWSDADDIDDYDDISDIK
jgi:hypothetical protein